MQSQISSNVSNIQGITDSQNTAIQAVDNFAHGAYDLANTKFASAGGDITGSVNITGDLKVTGNTLYANVQNLWVEDNIITVNSNVTGTPTLNAGLEVNRGNQANTSVIWNESQKHWTITNDGTNFDSIIVSQQLTDNVAFIQGIENAQNTHITAVENYAQGAYAYANASVSYIGGVDSSQNTRMSIIEGTDVSQNTRMSIIEGVDLGQNTYIGAVESYAQSAYAYANASVSYISGVDAQQNTNLSTANTFLQANDYATWLTSQSYTNTANSSMKSYVDTANTSLRLYSEANTGAALSAAKVYTDTANTSLKSYVDNANTSLRLYSEANTGAALAAAKVYTDTANTSLKSYVDNLIDFDTGVIQGINDTQNTRIQSVETINNNQNTAIQAVDNYAHTAFDYANTSVSYISGVDLAQNTAIQAVDDYAHGAYGLANTKFASDGGTIAGSVLIQNDLSVLGNVTFTGNVTSVSVTGNTGQFFGYSSNGFNALYAGIPLGYTIEPQTILQATGNYNGYTQINLQNINNGTNASGDIVITADNGTANDTYIDMGINGSNYTQAEFGLTGPNDGYLYVSGNTTTGGGNLVLSTLTQKDIIFSTYGSATSDEVMRINSSNNVVISSTNRSVDTTSGSLQVAGGVGVTGNIHAEQILSHGLLTAANNTNGQVVIGQDSNGGVEIGLPSRSSSGTPFIDFHSSAGGNLDYDARITANGGGFSDGQGTLTLVSNQTTISKDLLVNNSITANTLTINDTSDSISNTTGSLVLYGGLGVGANVYFGPTGALTSTTNQVSLKSTGPQDVVLQSGGNKFIFATDGHLNLPQGADIVDYQNNTVLNLQAVTTKGPSSNQAISLTNSSNATSTSTGALKVTGGVGIGGNVYTDAVYTDNYYTTDKVPLIQPVNQFAQNAFDKANSAFDSSNAVNQYAQSAYALANTNANAITVIQGVDLGQNTYISAVENYSQSAYAQANVTAGGLLTANANISYNNGVNLTQNTYIQAVESYSQTAFNFANTNIAIIQGVDLTQNTNITATNNFAAGAYAQANAANNMAQGAYNKANASVQFDSFTSAPNQFLSTNASGYITTTSAVSAGNVSAANSFTLGTSPTLWTETAQLTVNLQYGSPQTLDTWSATGYRMAKYQVVATAAIGYQYHEFIIIHDDTTPTLSITVETVPNGKIANYGVSIAGGVVTVTANTQSNATFVMTKEYFYNAGSNYLPVDLQLITSGNQDLQTGIPDNTVIDLPVAPA